MNYLIFCSIFLIRMTSTFCCWIEFHCWNRQCSVNCVKTTNILISFLLFSIRLLIGMFLADRAVQHSHSPLLSVVLIRHLHEVTKLFLTIIHFNRSKLFIPYCNLLPLWLLLQTCYFWTIFILFQSVYDVFKLSTLIIYLPPLHLFVK